MVSPVVLRNTPSKLLDLSGKASLDTSIGPNNEGAVVVDPLADSVYPLLPAAHTHRAAGQPAVLLPPLPHSCRIRCQQFQVGREGFQEVD